MASLFKSLAWKFSQFASRHLLSETNVRRMRWSKLYRELIQREDNQVARLQAEYAGLVRDPDKRARLRLHERKIFSQSGEDGLLLHLFSIVGAPGKTFIEFGIEDGTECNSANLAIHFGWRGLFIEGSPHLAEKARQFYHSRHRLDAGHVRVECAFVTRENVNELFAKGGFTGGLDLLSIDIDGGDYWVWEQVRAVNPRIVVMEYNASFGSEETVTVPYEPAFDRYRKHPSGWYHGASLAALTKLANTKGYLLAGCDSLGANAFFVRRDLAAGRLEEFTPAEAFYPSAPRLREKTQAEQMALLWHLPLVKV